MDFELNRIELHTTMYVGKDAAQYFRNMQDKEEEDDETYEERLIRESLHGMEAEVNPPTPYTAIVRIDPREVYSEQETFSLKQSEKKDPVFDNVELVMKNGDTHIVTESLAEYKAIRKAYFQWEKEQEQATKETN